MKINMTIIGLLLPMSLLFSGCEKEKDDNNNEINTDGKLQSSVTELAFSDRSDSQVVTITSEKEWGFISCDEWISVDPKSSFEKSTQVTVTVQENNTVEVRKGQIGFKSGADRLYLTVTQTGLVNVVCSPENGVIDAAGGNLEFAVTTEPVSEWTAKADADWYSVKGEGSKLIVTISENVSSDFRKGIITVTCGLISKEIAIRQRGSDNITCPLSDDYMLVWHDEFESGDQLSSKDWEWENWQKGNVNNELQYYRPGTQVINGMRTTEIVDGVLNINCFKDTDGKVYSGRVNAKNGGKGWQYGYIEARILLPKGKGTWPAFWMMPISVDWAKEGWPKCGEIDIMEEVGADPNVVSSSLHAEGHYHANNTQITKAKNIGTAESEYHVYALEWTKEGINTYVDGVKLLSYKSDGTVRNYPYDKPFHVILNLAWGGDWGGYKGVDESALPLTMKVDYVRVFQKD